MKIELKLSVSLNIVDIELETWLQQNAFTKSMTAWMIICSIRSVNIFYDQLGTLSRGLGILNAEHQRAVVKKSPQDQIFQVGNYM